MHDPIELWESGSLDDWRALMSSYYSLLSEHKVLDQERWFRDSLPDILVKQKGCLTKDQFIRLVEWKLSRGKFRPSLRGYAAKQDPKALETASKEAYRIIMEKKGAVGEDTVVQAMTELTALKGVGPATASAMLAAMDDSIPFMSDEALTICLGKREYTVKAYRSLLNTMRAKHVSLQQQVHDRQEERDRAPADGICIKDMEAALFASSIAAHGSDAPLNGQDKSSNKKKRRKTHHDAP